jgi:Domain of unknown function (DUF5668)
MNGYGMNRYILIRRLRWPAILLLLGLLALLDQFGIIENFWGLFWPLLLILIGVLLLAERAALAMEGYAPYSCGPWGGVADQNPAQPPADPGTNPGTSIVPARTESFGNGADGGQS